MNLRKHLAGLAAVAALVAGCAYDDTPLPEPEASPAPTPATPLDCTTDEQTLRSFPPSEDVGAAREELIDADRLVVGISADTLLMGSRDPIDERFEGFDIDIVRRIAAELFGEDYKPTQLKLRVITAADRIPLLENGEIDLVVRNMTINCDRWKQVAFSQVYYGAEQKVLFREDLAPGYDSISDLAGLRVCAPTGSTSLTNIQEQEPDVVIEPASTHTGCLVKLQQGEVDAITGDDTVLAGLAAQDPYAVVPGADSQPFISNEPYGVAANSDDVDLVRLVNSVLEKMRTEGSWQRSYDLWLAPYLGPGEQPQPVTPYREP